jgi:hypothetical protein
MENSLELIELSSMNEVNLLVLIAQFGTSSIVYKRPLTQKGFRERQYTWEAGTIVSERNLKSEKKTLLEVLSTALTCAYLDLDLDLLK